MSKKTISVEVGTEPKEAPKNVVKAEPAILDEVGGRDAERRYMECFKCGQISTIWYDATGSHSYECCYCNAINNVGV